MNCAECQELLVAYLEGLLDDSEKQAVEGHVQQCETCRTELEGLQTLQQRLVDHSQALTHSDLEDQVMNRIIREQSARLKTADQAGLGLRLRRLLMKSSMAKVAVAAAVILAAAGGICLWTGTTSSVALADVLARVEQVGAFMYTVDTHMTMAVPGATPVQMNMKMTTLIADNYGWKVDASSTDPTTGQATEQQIYLLPEQNTMLVVTPATKTYERQKLDAGLLQAKQKENSDPRLVIRQMLACQYEDLGKTVRDGLEVQGFRTTDPSYGGGLGRVDATLWVDAKTWLPVRLDMQIKMDQGTESQTTLHDFRWDVPVSAAEFHPVVPADYTPGVADGAKAVSPTEQGALEGLRLCVDLVGKYPEGFGPAELMETMKGLATSQTPAAKKFQQEMAQAKSPQEGATKGAALMMPVQSLAMFHMLLVQQKKDPAYYGKIVKPGDAAQVLLRWKTGENEYRVIFGDLRAITVDADTLAKLEAALPK